MTDFILRGAFSDDCETRRARLDLITHTLQVIDYEHHEIHSGSFFRVQHNNASIDELIIAFKVGDQSKNPHFVFEWVSESFGSLQLLEGSTWTAGTGTDRPPKNSRRDSTKESVLQGNATGVFLDNNVVVDPTGLTGGTVISDKRVYSDNKQGGGSGERRNEIILATNQTYALVWTSGDGNKGIQIRCSWYEHTDKT